jgi:hypothetical protein
MAAAFIVEGEAVLAKKRQSSIESHDKRGLFVNLRACLRALRGSSSLRTARPMTFLGEYAA